MIHNNLSISQIIQIIDNNGRSIINEEFQRMLLDLNIIEAVRKNIWTNRLITLLFMIRIMTIFWQMYELNFFYYTSFQEIYAGALATDQSSKPSRLSQ